MTSGGEQPAFLQKFFRILGDVEKYCVMRPVKTEHSGAKNGGGYWGTRKEAKDVSKRLRRSREKMNIRRAIAGDGDEEFDPDWDWTEGS